MAFFIIKPICQDNTDRNKPKLKMKKKDWIYQ
jgi:hypothetical protein